MTRTHWGFEYRAVSRYYAGSDDDTEAVVALTVHTAADGLATSLGELDREARVECLLARAPLFWYRLRLSRATNLDWLLRALVSRGVPVRYVTSAVRGNLLLGDPAEFDSAPPCEPRDWATLCARAHVEPRSDGRWPFHEPGGVDVDRAVCGTGAGMRLAAIDDEARDADVLPLDREVLVSTASPSRGSQHGSLMVAWSVGVLGDAARKIPQFTGIAPDASARLYLIPKPGHDVTSLPCAIVRAVDDGADVIMCATYVDGATSPLLDDALNFAVRLGRAGKGTAVVVPTGREISSAEGSLHASLTLHLGDPASDPRVLCVAPTGRDGGWFLWQDKRGRLRPFANRGPAVRVGAPGDDMSYPLAWGERIGHAESSGASAVAAGVALLVLGTNPDLLVSELYDVLVRSATRTERIRAGVLADPADVLPASADPDGHDAKCGYGRISAARACAFAADPLAAALVAIGEDVAARRYLTARATDAPFIRALAGWAARVSLRDPSISHSLRVLARHLRLVGSDRQSRESHPSVAFMRQLAVLGEQFLRLGPPSAIRNEAAALARRALASTRGEGADVAESWLFSLAARLFAPPRAASRGDDELCSTDEVGAFGRSA
jgi:hypothetical protein